MAIEIVDFPIKHGDFPLLFVCSPGRVDLEVSTEAKSKAFYFGYSYSRSHLNRTTKKVHLGGEVRQSRFFFSMMAGGTANFENLLVFFLIFFVTAIASLAAVFYIEYKAPPFLVAVIEYPRIYIGPNTIFHPSWDDAFSRRWPA